MQQILLTDCFFSVYLYEFRYGEEAMVYASMITAIKKKGEIMRFFYFY